MCQCGASTLNLNKNDNASGSSNCIFTTVKYHCYFLGYILSIDHHIEHVWFVLF